MKVFQLYYPHEGKDLPKEDAWAVNEKNSSFAVADGVTLYKGLEFKDRYPSPSPAGILAEEFCSTFVKSAGSTDIVDAFSVANQSVFYLNKDRDKANTFSKAEAYYAATGSFGRINGNILEYGYICDSSVSVINQDGDLVFSLNDHTHHNGFDTLLSKYSVLDYSYILRTVFRNAVSPDGDKLGYGVITGEKEAEKYVIFGEHILEVGEIIVFATDGFEKYLQDSTFRKALVTLDKSQVDRCMIELKKQHGMIHDYTAERTLVAVRYS